jgi:glycosyltransferase involved in cell wall biosynthesis
LSPLLTHQTGRALLKSKRIKSLITENHFDVIHYHNMSLIGLDVLRLGQAIKLYTLHEYWLVCPMHILLKYGREVCRKRACIRCQIAGKRPVQWWRYGKTLKNYISQVDLFISPSRFAQKRHHQSEWDIPIAHLPNFLPSSLSQAQTPPMDTRPHESSSYFLYVGRLEKLKGVHTLIDVFRRYSRADLLIAGSGPYAATLQTLAKDIPNIRFLGRLPYSQLSSLYRHAHALLVPSICLENCPLVIPEAFSQKTPVIVNNIGGLPEIVQQSGGGLLYSTEKELLGHLDALRLNTRLRESLGRQGYDAYVSKWTEAQHIERYFHMIKTIAAQKGMHNPAIKSLAAT